MSTDWTGDDPFGPADHHDADHHELEPDPLAGGDHDHLGADLPAADHPTADYPAADHPAAEPLAGGPYPDAPGSGQPDLPDDPAWPADPGHGAADSGALEHEPTAVPPEADPPAAQPDHTDALPQHLDTSPFPPHLEVDVVAADGLDWVDPHLLGEPENAGYAPALDNAAALAGLRAAEGADPAGSEDPAVRALALFWGVKSWSGAES
jgi:hypothetical protein